MPSERSRMYRDLKKEATAKKLADAANEAADIATE